jgi:hypothetical protein
MVDLARRLADGDPELTTAYGFDQK